MSTMRKLLLVVLAVVSITALAYNISNYSGALHWLETPTYVKVVTLERGMKLVNISWNQSALWYVVRPMRAGEVAERYEFKGDGYQLMTVAIQEQVSIFPQQ